MEDRAKMIPRDEAAAMVAAGKLTATACWGVHLQGYQVGPVELPGPAGISIAYLRSATGEVTIHYGHPWYVCRQAS